MLTKIVVVVALCAGNTVQSVQSKLADLRAKHPDATVTYRIDKHAKCVGNQVLTGKDAKLAEALGKGI